MKKDPYQTFKPLNTEAFAGLLESIKLLGILQPVITDEKKFKGIIDGHHRYKAAKSLGWKDDDIPYTIVTGLSEDAKRLLSRSLNIASGRSTIHMGRVLRFLGRWWRRFVQKVVWLLI